MSNLIRIKRSTSTATPVSLANGELAITSAGGSDVLYIGSNGTIVPIGGKRDPGVLTANQALVANSSSGIDKIIVANAAISQLNANGASGTAGHVLKSGGAGSNSYWEAPATTVAGSDTQIQFNDGGSLAGDSGLTFNKSSDTLSTNNVFATSTVNAATLSVGTSVVANSSRLAIATTVGLQANGGIGTDGQILYSNGSTAYWASAPAGDITSVTAGNGLTGSGTSGDITLDVVAANGITVSADAVGVLANSGLVANATGLHILTTGDTTLIANSLGLFVNDASISIATSQLTGDVALGSNTSGNYVASLSAANGIAGAVAAAEGTTPSLYVVANNGIVANSSGVFAKANNGITVDADGISVKTGSTLTVNTLGVHVNNILSITDLTVSGNLTVLGDLVSLNVATLSVEDSLITLAKDQSSTGTFTDALDIGFFGTFGNTANSWSTGLFRDQSDSGVWKLFNSNGTVTNTNVDTTAGFNLATLSAFLSSGGLTTNSISANLTANSTYAVGIIANTLTLSTALAGTSGGTGKTTVANNSLLVGNSTNGYVELTLGASGLVLQSNGTALVYDILDGGSF